MVESTLTFLSILNIDWGGFDLKRFGIKTFIVNLGTIKWEPTGLT